MICSTTPASPPASGSSGKGFAVTFGGEALGHYASPSSAAEDLANGTCSWPSNGDPSNLGIPENISEWQRVR
ncbi:hypothetical protein DCG74_00050 [Bradyrhizobium sp. WBAH42]|nr:hypothetical protein [Bradyrhizobium sp. WBAH30]MDD1546195.1 hypothetical protein [Bradyrhizobium sp. WBAH41]MDD1560075.1 hypothetical protein [Bradyrhizobium sp. WBAH23]MDD1567177.1 hypothetical protein [Bradyrhizobium sp. WBAH33]MDD1593485.1 hypothetical protein [Bradyrhizobium sp. WBAH42]NRB90686.1 hypothetical protein [Bradyrhizobium sp. WBAH10]QCJ93700.1 hypothetical protein DAA57_00055 [Bradyrhizobium yuanmingense]